MFRLRLFGGLALVGPDGPVRGRAVQPRRLALLALLGASRNHGWSREKIIALLWPDSDPVETRHHLSQSLYLLRKALGEDAISSHGEFIGLNADVVGSDVAAFYRALKAGELAVALDLYTGPFLDGFYIRGAPDFEDWSEAERRSLADAYATAVETLARAAGGEGNHIEAADLWRRLVSHDPYNSRAVLGLMQSLVEGGDPGNALLVAEEHADRMHDDLGVGPGADVEALTERIRVNLPARRFPVAGRPMATGRDGGPEFTEEESEGAPLRRVPTWLMLTTAAALGAAAVIWAGSRLSSPLPTPPYGSVGVLPFVNMTGDSALDHLADGVTDELISTLSRVRGLKVPAQTSSFHFKDRPLEARAIGDSLGVRVLLEGSLRRVEDGLRVTAQLIDAETGFHLWTETYDRAPADWPKVPAEIASHAVVALGIDGAGASPGFAPRTEILSVWEDYEKGRRYWRLRTREAHDTAFAAFRRAIEADSTFALAWSGLVDTHLTSMDIGDMPDDDSVRAEVRAMAVRGVELDSALAETRTSYAAVLWKFDRDLAAAEAEYRRAIEIDPGYAVAYDWYWELLNGAGRYDDAWRVIQQGYEVDPLSPVTTHHMGWTLLWGEARVAEALRYFEYVLDVEPDHRVAQINRGVSLAFLGRFDEARDAALHMLETNPDDMTVASHTARIMALVRDYDRVESIVDSIDASESRYARYYTAGVFAEQGRYEDALAEYREAAKQYSEDDELKLLIAYVYGLSGDAARARAIADPISAAAWDRWLTENDRQSRWLLRNAATVYGAIGDNDTAFELFEQVMEIRKGTLANLAVHASYDSLRDDPRFDALLERLGLPKIDDL